MTPAEELALLKDVWVRTGALHDLQIHQLKNWARIIFPNETKKAETRIDTDTWTVDFVVEPKFLSGLFGLPKGAIVRCAQVESWVHQLLDSSVQVRVTYGKKMIYVGSRLQSSRGPLYDGVDFSAGSIVPSKPWEPKKGVKY